MVQVQNMKYLTCNNHFYNSYIYISYHFFLEQKISDMVILKSEEQIFDDNDYKDWNWLFFNNKEADCIFYSEDGHGFRIHKEILSQSGKMRNILSSFKENCCGTMEILCLCPKNELEQLVTFLYRGIISFNVDLFKILDNLITIFGFPENLTLNDENGKEFNRDEFLSEEIKREKGITRVHSETISFQTNVNIKESSIFENNENNIYTDSSILEDKEMESNAKSISKINLESSKESLEGTILSRDYEKSPEIGGNVDGANSDHAKSVLTMNIFEKHETNLNLGFLVGDLLGLIARLKVRVGVWRFRDRRIYPL